MRLLSDPSLNAKCWYVWYFAASVSVGPFLNVYFAERGLSKAQVGLIGALRPWSSAPASFAWAALADRLGAHRAVLLGCLVAACAVRMLLLLPSGFAGLLAAALAAEVLASPVGVLADAAVMQICGKESDYGKYRLWGAVGWGSFSTAAGWLITRFGTRAAFFTNALLSLPCLMHGARLHAKNTHVHGHGRGHVHGRGHEGATLNGAGLKGRDSDGGDAVYDGSGRGGGGGGGGSAEAAGVRSAAGEAAPLLAAQRGEALGAVEMTHRAAAAVAASVGTEAGAGAGPDGAAAAAAAAALGGGDAAAAAQHGGGAGGGAAGREGYWRELRGLLRRGEVLLFFGTTLAMGYGFGTIDSFLFLYLEQMGASETLMGLTLTITCAAEVPAFQMQDRLLERWGVTGVLDLVQAVYVLRLALYAALPMLGSVMWVLPVEVLHGVTFACGWGAGTVNCKGLAPPGLAATLQGTFQALYFGAGYGLGSLVGGAVGSALGWQGMFAIASLTMLGLWLCVLGVRAATGLTLAGRAPKSGYVELRTVTT